LFITPFVHSVNEIFEVLFEVRVDAEIEGVVVWGEGDVAG
jgi:hypothetical protein